MVTELDYMEYANDAAAQAAYVNNGGINDAYTKLLLHLDALAFTDESGKSVTNTGVTLDTTNKVFGAGSAYFNGVSTYLQLADSDDWNFGSGDFTINFRIRWITLTNASVMGQDEGGGSHLKWMVNWNAVSANHMSFHFQNPAGTSYVVAWSWIPSTGIFYDCEIDRQGNNWYFFVNGTQTGETQTQSAAVPDVSAPLTIGTDGEAYCWHVGNLDEIRISKGIARHTSNFSSPTSAFAPLQSYSEATIKTQGSYSLKAIAAITDSLNKTLTRTIA